MGLNFQGLNRDSNPGPLAPKARIIPLDHWAVAIANHDIFQNLSWELLITEMIMNLDEPIIARLKHAQRGARTHDPEIKSLMLYRLS